MSRAGRAGQLLPWIVLCLLIAASAYLRSTNGPRDTAAVEHAVPGAALHPPHSTGDAQPVESSPGDERQSATEPPPRASTGSSGAPPVHVPSGLAEPPSLASAADLYDRDDLNPARIKPSDQALAILQSYVDRQNAALHELTLRSGRAQNDWARIMEESGLLAKLVPGEQVRPVEGHIVGILSLPGKGSFRWDISEGEYAPLDEVFAAMRALHAESIQGVWKLINGG